MTHFLASPLAWEQSCFGLLRRKVRYLGTWGLPKTQSLQLPCVTNNWLCSKQVRALLGFYILYHKALSRFLYLINAFSCAELNPDLLRKVLILSRQEASKCWWG